MQWSLNDVIEWFERVYERTAEVAQAIPPEKIDWQPAPDEFSCGNIIRHIGSTELMNVARLQTGHLSYGGHSASQYGQTRAEVLAYLSHAHTQAVQMLQEGGEAALTRLVPTNQGDIPGWRVLVGMLEHEIHHRSQLCSYLSELGLPPPPLYGLYVEELPH